MSDLPKRISNLKQRKGESDADWAIRYYAKRHELEEKRLAKEKALREQKQRKALLARDPATLQRLREFGGLTDEEIQRLALPAPIQLPQDGARTLRHGSYGDASVDDHGLENVRFAMAYWIDATWKRKLSEASCDLLCLRCPSALVLNCAAQNYTAAQKDGHTIPIEEI